MREKGLKYFGSVMCFIYCRRKVEVAICICRGFCVPSLHCCTYFPSAAAVSVSVAVFHWMLLVPYFAHVEGSFFLFGFIFF